MFKSFTGGDKGLLPRGKGSSGSSASSRSSSSSRSPSRSPSSRSSGSSPEPAPPATVQWAVKLMLVGAAISTVYLVFALFVTRNVKSVLTQYNATLPKAKQLSPGQVSNAANSYIFSTILIGVIAIALWLWMARMNNNGKAWARITASILFALWSIYTWFSIGDTRGSGTLIAATVMVLVTWLVGVGALFLLWRPASTVFFKDQSR